MIDLRYHIASIVAVFLALSLGIIIGSTIVSEDVLVDQQKKMIDNLEEQFYALRQRESELVASNEYQNKLISNYENYGQVTLPIIVGHHLAGRKIGIVITGGTDIPPGLLNALSLAEAEVVSRTVVLTNIALKDAALREKLVDYYNLEADITDDAIRYIIGASTAAVILNQAPPETAVFLQENELIKFSYNGENPPETIIIVGGAEDISMYYAGSLDKGLINYFANQGIKVYGVEYSQAVFSYMEVYQESNITTIDNIDLSPGQISLIFALDGEAGNYGIKSSAKRFMPAILMDESEGER